MNMAWARQARDLAVKYGLAFFFKQASGGITELRPWLVEENGTRYRWQQYPGQMTKPKIVAENPWKKK
jgi:hypothetical protein